MNFIHETYQPGETIAAIATPLGEGGVAIIRISGKDAIEIAKKIFSGPVESYQSHTAHYGRVINLAGEHIDDVLILVMLGKRSYTGEDTVEIQCHGGSLITRRVLETVLEAGARAARPGEFTLKAFMNGKMDLAQAEAVQELICAKNEYALNAAEKQLKGSFSAKIIEFQNRLTKIAAILEAWVDFPEEDIEFASMDDVANELNNISQKLEKLIATFRDGKIIHEGLSLCLIGSPNVGKSSLMNALLDKERAIVSDIPGTTRDLIEDNFRLNGLNLKLIDTAGIRDSIESVEQEGIRRTKKAMEEADLILLILDASREITKMENELISQVPQNKTIVALNKIDLGNTGCTIREVPFVKISAKEKLGLDLLKSEIDKVIWKCGPPAKDEILITNVRHRDALQKATEACQVVVNGLKQGISPEFLAFEMRQSLKELGKIIGRDITEDILSSIFSQFCIGK